MFFEGAIVGAQVVGDMVNGEVAEVEEAKGFILSGIVELEVPDAGEFDPGVSGAEGSAAGNAAEVESETLHLFDHFGAAVGALVLADPNSVVWGLVIGEGVEDVGEGVGQFVFIPEEGGVPLFV